MRETMNCLKKMAFVLALVAGFCGGAWAEDWGHRNGARESHSWARSAPEHGRAGVPNRTWGSRSNPNYGDAWWGSHRNNPSYHYRNGAWVYAPNRTWGTTYPYGTSGSYYPYGTSGGYYPYPTTGGYPSTGGYYPGGTSNGNGAASIEYQRGYRDGVMYGRSARASGRGYHPMHQAPYAKNADYAYRQGFAAGYNRGFMN